MDVRKYMNLLDPNNEKHRELVRAMAKSKANYDVLKEKRHRQDPTLIQAAKDFRTSCDNVRRAALNFYTREVV